MIVDTHAHLDMAEFADDLKEVIERAVEAGIGRIITVGIDIESSLKAIELAERYPAVWAAAGVHPNAAQRWDSDSESRIAEMLKHSKVIAVGETGLDFYRRHTPPDIQKTVFRKHLSLAADYDLPVIIHARQANEEVLNILRESGPGLKGVSHCFSGSLKQAREYLDLGMKLSIGGPLTYPGAADTRNMVKTLQAESFMAETDCPYLAPQKYRGKRNEPSMIVEVLEEMARQKGLSIDDMARITTMSARDLFGLDLSAKQGEIVYRIRRSIYLNITNRCPNQCTFCGRWKNYRVKGHDLRLVKEPTVPEILEAVEKFTDFDEIVFCGYGEPLLRLDVVNLVAKELKGRGYRIRINTNGLASLIHGKSIPEELTGIVDAYSISLNAQDAKTYDKLCRPSTGPGSYEAVIDFIKEAVGVTGDVTVTAVNLPGVDIEACRKLAESFGARFRARTQNEVG